MAKHSIGRVRPSTANSQQSRSKIETIQVGAHKRKLAIQHSKAMAKFKQIEVQGKLVEEVMPERRVSSKTRYNT